ncbi:MAG: AAA family ATPase [Saprospiraceae bacterium]|nr:AAA family ATPase [Saprospiraceae bacterium]
MNKIYFSSKFYGYSHSVLARIMSNKTSSFTPDPSNKEFNFAMDFIQNTDKSVFLTGKAGTGKTTFLKCLQERNKKNTIILAPTGVAAVNAGGKTIHSVFKIPHTPFLPQDARLRTKPDPADLDKSTIYDHFKYYKEDLQIFQALELLIIDEISMVRCDLLDVIDRLLRVFRKKFNQAFGGVQLLVIGDILQLPPVTDYQEWDILEHYYKSPYFFDAHAYQNLDPVFLQLKKIYRQQDLNFIELLNKVRHNKMTAEDFTFLNSRYDLNFEPPKDENYIYLTTHNKKALDYNLDKLNELESEKTTIKSIVSGDFPSKLYPADEFLELKPGAQIMILKNSRNLDYFNGLIGKLVSIEKNELGIQLENGKEIKLNKFTWENIRYQWKPDLRKIEFEVIGTFTQFPVKLAWAITVHKSQGLTFEKVMADLGSSFAFGQVYVALSRCTTIEKLVLKSKIDAGDIKVDPKVIDYAARERDASYLEDQLISSKADHYYKLSRQAFKSANFNEAFGFLKSALSLRNDLNTDLFERIILLLLQRLQSYKQKWIKLFSKYTTLVNAHSDLENHKLNLQEALEKELSTNQFLKKKIKDLEKKLNEMDAVMIAVQKKHRETMLLNLELEEDLDQQDQNIEDLEQEIHALRVDLEVRERELVRSQNLKWYHKLFGLK